MCRRKAIVAAKLAKSPRERIELRSNGVIMICTPTKVMAWAGTVNSAAALPSRSFEIFIVEISSYINRDFLDGFYWGD